MRRVLTLVALYLLLPFPVMATSGASVDDLRRPVPPEMASNEVFTPEQFGAVGDGRTDDTAGVQRALEEAASRGARVVLARDRTYLCAEAIDLPSGSHLSGHGPTSVLRFTWTENGPTTDGYYVGNEDQMSGNHDIVMDNFAIRGAGSGLPSGPQVTRDLPRVPGIRLRLVERFRITRLDVSRVAGISVLYQGASEGVITSNYVHDAGRDGITGTWHKRNLAHIVIKRNRMERIGDDGIALVGAPGQLPNTSQLPTDLVVRGNTILGWDKNPNGLLLGRGIVVLAGRRVVIEDNLIDRTHSNGILVAGSTRDFSVDPATGETWRSSDILVVNNRVVGAAQNSPGSLPVTAHEDAREAVLVKHSERVDLVGNVIEDPYGRAVSFVDCTDCSDR